MCVEIVRVVFAQRLDFNLTDNKIVVWNAPQHVQYLMVMDSV